VTLSLTYLSHYKNTVLTKSQLHSGDCYIEGSKYITNKHVYTHVYSICIQSGANWTD